MFSVFHGMYETLATTKAKVSSDKGPNTLYVPTSTRILYSFPATYHLPASSMDTFYVLLSRQFSGYFLLKYLNPLLVVYWVSSDICI